MVVPMLNVSHVAPLQTVRQLGLEAWGGATGAMCHEKKEGGEAARAQRAWVPGLRWVTSDELQEACGYLGPLEKRWMMSTRTPALLWRWCPSVVWEGGCGK
eukprot:1209637-Alexandrium_andersonii.AAC.1